jgi:hypothetical protein
LLRAAAGDGNIPLVSRRARSGVAPE